MKEFWLYELPSCIVGRKGGSGVFQGSAGPESESIVRQVASDPEDGVPFKVVLFEWVPLSEKRPDAGRLIVKRWKNGSVWAGVYSGSEKDSSFDEWVYLP